MKTHRRGKRRERRDELRLCARAAKAPEGVATEEILIKSPPEDLEDNGNGSSGQAQGIAPINDILLPDLILAYQSVPQDNRIFEAITDFFKAWLIFILPVAGPLTVFYFWKDILEIVHEVLGEEKGLLELTQLTLTPTTNGIVVACLATGLGTLGSLSVWTLRQRQQDLRSTINKEACELQLLWARLSADLAPNWKQNKVREPKLSDQLEEQDPTFYLHLLALLRQYAARLSVEASKRVDVGGLERQAIGTTELLGMVRTIADECSKEMGRFALSFQSFRDVVTEHARQLNDLRAQRVSLLLTSFPAFHWFVLLLLAASIALCFLIEVDQSEGRFLSERPEDSTRLRLTFTMLIGSFSGLAALLGDLSDPFRGSFCILGSADNFGAMVREMDDEIERILLRLRPGLSREDLEEVLKASDDNGNGLIDHEEFEAWLRRARGFPR